MIKNYGFICLFALSGLLFKAQTVYDIKINFKGLTDTNLYLAKYFFDQMPVVDSCVKIKNGKVRFSGNTALDKGMYFLANQAKNSYYFQFIVDANQKMTMTVDMADIAGTLKCTEDKQNQLFFDYIKFMTTRNQEMAMVQKQATGKSKEDSIKMVSAKQSVLSKEMYKYDADFRLKNKGTFVGNMMEMKAEKYPESVPLASNGRPDSTYQFYYYKKHFFDGVDFKDNKYLCTPFLADKIKRYFDQLVAQHPDSVIIDLDKILDQCIPGSDMFNTLLGHFTYKYEQNKTMSFDKYGKSNTFEKVFIHLADKYIITGKTNGYYSDETILKIKERVDILRNLLPGAKVSNLLMIDTMYGKQVLKMGFDTAKSSESVTFLYQKNRDQLQGMYKPLYNVNAKYTVLVFWAVDCSHCTKEVPKLYKDLQAIKGKIDYKMYAVQTKEDLYERWKTFIVQEKLTDCVHVFDPIHLNNLKDQFDIVATPVIYLLDKDKKIIGKKLGSEQVVEIIQQLDSIDKKVVK
ncbi:MAG: DUF5106 domain-containing protein [Bacteroidia bacterium]|nr:DUF5106 domain-containing protein [Bacteroidia bacterium]